MASGLNISPQLLQALITADHKGPRGPETTYNPYKGAGYVGRPHGHAPIQRKRGRPGRAAENRAPRNNAGLVHRQLLHDGHKKGCNGIDAEARGNETVPGSVTGDGEFS